MKFRFRIDQRQALMRLERKIGVDQSVAVEEIWQEGREKERPVERNRLVEYGV